MFEIRMKDGSTKSGQTPRGLVFKRFGVLIVIGTRHTLGTSEVVPYLLIDTVYVDGVIQYQSSTSGAD